jgi:hypothetical protein
MVERQSTADLDARRRVGLERGDRQAGEADEGGDARDLDHPETEPMELLVIPDADGQGVALGTVENLREELHRPRIGVHRLERLSVSFAPADREEVKPVLCSVRYPGPKRFPYPVA